MRLLDGLEQGYLLLMILIYTREADAHYLLDTMMKCTTSVKTVMKSSVTGRLGICVYLS